MGAEGSVTLQLREAVEAPDSSGQSDTTSLTIGYPETDLLADIHGSIQATGKLWPHAMLRTFSYHIITRNNKSFYQYWEGKKRRKELCIIYSFLTHSSLLLLRYVFVSLCGFYVRVNINLCALVCVCVRVRVVLYGALVAFMYLYTCKMKSWRIYWNRKTSVKATPTRRYERKRECTKCFGVH